MKTDWALRLADTIKRLPDSWAVAWDTETTGLSPYAGDYITGISVCLVDPLRGPLEGAYVPVGHRSGNVEPRAARAILEALAATEATHLLHNCPFDWAMAKTYGIDARSRDTVDTLVIRWLTDENLPKKLKVIGEELMGEDAGAEQRALKEAMDTPWANQTEAYKAVREAYPELPVKDARALARKMRQKRGWGDLRPEEIAPYAAKDAELTAGIFEITKEDPHTGALDREMELQHILFEMTDRGVGVNHAQLELARAEYAGRAQHIQDLLDEAYGSKWRARSDKNKGVFNPASTKQVGWLLYDEIGLPVMSRTEGGTPATDKNALEQLQGHPVAAKVLEYRHWVKAVSAYCDPYLAYLDKSADGRLHGMYSSTRTVTGRLSASNPNIMTIPRADTLPELRAAFTEVAPGHERLGFDLASAELWVTASITGDPVLTDALLDGRSLHVETMKAVFGTDDKSSRFYTLSKNVNYGALYEAGPDQLATFAAKAGFGPEQAQRIAFKAWRGHRDLYARQHYVADFLKDKAEQLGRLPLHVEGRYRHFKSPGVFVKTYTALNALVQGGIAEYMKDVMLEVCRRGYGELLVLQVHDELVFDAPVGMQQELLELLRAIAHDINPFKYEIAWEGKAWNA